MAEMGIEVIQLGNQVYTAEEALLRQHTDTLSLQHSEIQIGTRAIHALVKARQTADGAWDINQDDEMKKLMLCIYRSYPNLRSVLDPLVHNFPEGVLTQPIAFSSMDIEGVMRAALDGVVDDLNAVTINPLTEDDCAILRDAIEKELTIKANEVNQTTFKITQSYERQKQLTEILRQIAREFYEFLKSISRNTRSA